MSLILDVVTGLITSLLLVVLSFVFLFWNWKKKMKEDKEGGKDTSFKSFYNMFVLDKIESFLIDDHYDKDTSNNLSVSSDKYLNAVKDENINEKEVLKRKSKNYGADEEFSIRTWYGINYNKLVSDDIKYVSFSVKGENEPPIRLKAKDLIDFINRNLTSEEQESYKQRNSFDTYLMKSHEGKWYITRLGIHLDQAVEIR